LEPSRAPIEQGPKWRKTVADELAREDFKALRNTAVPSTAGFKTVSYRFQEKDFEVVPSHTLSFHKL
jgi:hypothetical protein|tara:strand:- start:498 stop:698 length:201 start_codon:yes stop_codon:yes gene_type:complete